MPSSPVSPSGRYNRRDVLRMAGLGMSAAALSAVAETVSTPQRAWARGGGPDGGQLAPPPQTKPDIQYAIGPFTPPPIQEQGIPFGLGGPVYTSLITARFARPISRRDQATMAYILDAIEGHYAFSPAGVFPIVSYGTRYFARLDALKAGVVAANMPTDTRTGRPVLVEAVPAPTDQAPGNAPVRRRFNVPVRIEDNDVLFSFRSDNPNNLADVEAWIFANSGRLNGAAVPSPDQTLLQKSTSRLLFVQIGLPKRFATQHGLSFAGQLRDDTPMWMGIADQNTNGAGPPEITAFVGNASAHITTARPGDYFDNGTVQVLNHNINDVAGWYATAGSSADFQRRLQLMFRATHAFGRGGETPFWQNQYFGAGDAELGAAGSGTPDNVHRIGHLTSLQRSSRAADGTPMHARMDGPGFSSLDVPDASEQPTLEFSAFVPSGDFFNTMRANSSAVDLAQKYGVADGDNGLESFICATRRQNFLSPPRRHRALPLIEFT